MILSTYELEHGRHVARLHHHCHNRRAFAPTRNTASHDTHEKINSWVSNDNMENNAVCSGNQHCEK